MKTSIASLLFIAAGCAPEPIPVTQPPPTHAESPPTTMEIATKAPQPNLGALCEKAQLRWYELVQSQHSKDLTTEAKAAMMAEEKARESQSIRECVDRNSVDAAECQVIAPHMLAFTTCNKLAGPRPEPRASRKECQAVNEKLADLAGKPTPEGDTMMLFVFTCLMTLSKVDIACAMKASDVTELAACDAATKRR